MQSKFSLLILLAILCLPLWVNAQKVAKIRSQARKTAECKSNDVSFKCPKESKVVLNGSTVNGIFLARRANGYGVFVLAPKETFEEQNLMA